MSVKLPAMRTERRFLQINGAATNGVLLRIKKRVAPLKPILVGFPVKAIARRDAGLYEKIPSELPKGIFCLMALLYMVFSA